MYTSVLFHIGFGECVAHVQLCNCKMELGGLFNIDLRVSEYDN